MMGYLPPGRSRAVEPSPEELAEMEADEDFQALFEPLRGAEPIAEAAVADASWEHLKALLEQDGRRCRRPMLWGTGVRLSVAIALGLGLGAFGLSNPRADLGEVPVLHMAAILLAFVAVLIAAVAIVFRPLYRPLLSPTRTWLWALTLLFLPQIIALLPQGQSLDPQVSAGTGPEFWPGALSCLEYGSALGVILLFVLMRLDRSAWIGRQEIVLAASAAGAAANLALQLHCPSVHPEHLVVGHGSVGFGLAVLGGLLVMAWRSIGGGRSGPLGRA